MEYQFPVAREVIPADALWKYIKTRDVVEAKPRTTTDTNKLYKSVLAQVTLRTLYEVFTADTFEHIKTICFNGFVNDDDPTTGRPIQPRLVSLRADREEYLDRGFLPPGPSEGLAEAASEFLARTN